MAHKKYTIKDIAEQAGVSKGTVDRVLHKRGKVSEKALKKVEQVLQDIDFQPNPIARNLKNNKVYRICVLMPNDKDDLYWAPARQGIMKARKEFKPFGVMVEEYLYHPYDRESFVHASQMAIVSHPNAILMVPLFQDEARQILAECNESNILVALFNNYVDEFKGEKFIGQDLYQSGRVAADLVDKIVPPNAKIGIAHVNLEPHMQLKQRGFEAYFQEKNSQISIETKNFTTDTETALKRQIEDFFNLHSDIAALFVTNSKAYTLLKVMNELGKEIAVVGYDLLEKNIEYLKAGKIDFLIHQKPGRQAYLGVGYLSEHFLFEKKVPDKELLPIDIVTAENVDYTN